MQVDQSETFLSVSLPPVSSERPKDPDRGENGRRRVFVWVSLVSAGTKVGEGPLASSSRAGRSARPFFH